MAKLKVFSLFLIIGAFNLIVFSKDIGNFPDRIQDTQLLKEMMTKYLQNPTKLITLNASNKHLTEIDPRFFINAPKIGFVDFSNNSIQHIDPSAFEGVTNLKTLNLSHNKIDKLESDWFPFPYLSTLDLSRNKLTVLNKSVFKKLINLKHLNLSGNSIGNVEVETFSHQKKLISLDLSQNNLVMFDFHVFSSNPNNSQKLFVKIDIFTGIQSLGDPYLNEHLQSLDLSKNQLIEVNNFRHGNFSQLDLLDINENKFNCSYLRIFLDSIRWGGIDIHANESWQKITEGDNIHGVHCTAVITSETSSSGSESSDNFFLIKILLTFLCICSTSVLIIISFLGRKQLFNCGNKDYKFDVDTNSKHEKIFSESNQNSDDENKLNQVMPATTG